MRACCGPSRACRGNALRAPDPGRPRTTYQQVTEWIRKAGTGLIDHLPRQPRRRHPCRGGCGLRHNEWSQGADRHGPTDRAAASRRDADGGGMAAQLRGRHASHADQARGFEARGEIHADATGHPDADRAALFDRMRDAAHRRRGCRCR